MNISIETSLEKARKLNRLRPAPSDYELDGVKKELLALMRKKNAQFSCSNFKNNDNIFPASWKTPTTPPTPQNKLHGSLLNENSNNDHGRKKKRTVGARTQRDR